MRRKGLADFFLIRFSTNLLIIHYTHIGFKKQFTNCSFAKALLGYYSGISIINPDVTLFKLKLCVRFLFALLLQNKKFCFISYDFPFTTKRNSYFFGNYYIFNNWPFGLVSNSITTLQSSRILKKKSYYPNTPSAFLTLDVNSSKLFYIISEANNFAIPVFSFADSNIGLDPLNYWIPTNLKNHKSKWFWFMFIKKLTIKSFIRRKLLFVKASKKNHLDFFKKLIIQKRLKYWRYLKYHKYLFNFRANYLKYRFKHKYFLIN